MRVGSNLNEKIDAVAQAFQYPCGCELVLTFEGETPVMEMFQYPIGYEVVHGLETKSPRLYKVSIPDRV